MRTQSFQIRMEGGEAPSFLACQRVLDDHVVVDIPQGAPIWERRCAVQVHGVELPSKGGRQSVEECATQAADLGRRFLFRGLSWGREGASS